MMLSLLSNSLEYKNPSPIHTVSEAMEKCQSLTTSSELIFMSILLSLFASSSSHVSEFVSCLAASGVRNVTLFAQVDQDGAAAYYNLLTFSIQNLRFATRAVAKPAAIVLPANVEELAGTILCVRKQGPWSVRVRSGGHSYEGLSSIADHKTPFVIVDLMNLNRVQVDVRSKTAWVEAGATIGETYHAIAHSSDTLGFPAGSCPTVGSGGHIAGGGFGFLSRKYGLAADNVIDAVLVDSTGRILNRDSMGEDVFWAIRGGGGGTWGAVYAWKIKLVRVPKTLTVFVVSRPGSPRQVAELVHKWQLVGPKLPGDFYLSLFVGAGLPEATKNIGVSATFKGFYLGPKAKAASIMKRVFPELPILEEDCEEMSWIESVLYFSGLENGSSIDNLKDRKLHDKHYFKGKSDYVKEVISVEDILVILNILSEEPKGYLILDPYGGIMENISSNSLPFPHRDGNIYSIQHLVEWKEEDNWRSKELMKWLGGLYDSMVGLVSKGPRAAYVNYLDLDLGVIDWSNRSNVSENDVEMAREWGEKYFLGNFDRLVKAKTEIDPNNVFNNPQSIPPLPPAVGLADQ